MRARMLVLASMAVVLVGCLPPQTHAQGCSITLSAQPQVLNYPSGTLPRGGGQAFGVILNVNYTPSLGNSTLTLQYLKGTRWTNLENFTGNAVGFNEIDYGVTTPWAKFGDNEVRVVGPGCSSNIATFHVQSDSSAGVVDLAVYSLLGAAGAGLILLGKKLRWTRFIIAAALLYVALSPLTGQRYDIYFLLSSGIRILQHVNPFNPGSPPVYPGPLKWAYPPVYPVYSALSFLVYQLITGAALPTVSALTYPGWVTSSFSVYQAYVPPTLPVLVFFLKIPMVVSAILIGVLLRRMTGKDRAAAWWIANPLVILVAAIWGQTDPISTALALASVYSYERNRPYHAYLFASFGAAVKFWPFLLIPLMLASSLRDSGKAALKPLIAAVPAALVTLGLYALYGNPAQTLLLLAYARAVPTFAGTFSVNGLTWQEVLFLAGSPPIPIFLLVGLPLYCVIVFTVFRRKDRDIVKWLVVSILVFFLTYNYVNPQYFFWILPFLMLQRLRKAAVVFTALPLLYVSLGYNAFYFVSASLLPNEFAYGASILDQLKVSVFYQNPWVFAPVAAILPTIAYIVLLRHELKLPSEVVPLSDKT